MQKREESSYRSIKRLIGAYLRPYWFRVLIVAIVTSMSAMAPYVFGYLGKVVVDDVLQLGEIVKKTASEQLHLLLWVFFAYVAVHLLSIGFTWFYSYNLAYVSQRIVYTLRQQLHEKLQRLQMTFFDQRQTGKIVARVIDDVNVIQGNATNTLINIISRVALLLVGVVILLKLNFTLAFIAFATLPLYAISYQILVRRIREINQSLRKKNAEIYGLLDEKITGARVIKSFAQEHFEIRKFFRKAVKFIRLIMKNVLFNNTLSAIATVISGVGMAVVLWYGALQVRAGTMSLGSLLYFYSSVGVLFSPLITLTNMNVITQRLLAVLGRVFSVLDEEVTIKDSENAVELAEVKGGVNFRHVWLKYEGANEYDLKDIDFEVPPGCTISLVGPSGSGKSSLVNLLLRLYDPTEGDILIDGQSTKGIKLTSLRKHIGMVPQEAILFSGTIAQNIKYGRFNATPQQVINAAKVAEIHDFICSLPEKYETQIGERGMNLSGGQKQRLALAMALLTDPTILILDDSTSALDAETEARLWVTLKKIMANRTSFVITHRISTAMNADFILVLDKGRIVERGSHEELIATSGIYRRLFEQQRTAA